jgi:hypothetical protein
MEMRSLDMIISVNLECLHILSSHIDIICRSYLIKTSKMVNHGKIVLKVS